MGSTFLRCNKLGWFRVHLQSHPLVAFHHLAHNVLLAFLSALGLAFALQQTSQALGAFLFPIKLKLLINVSAGRYAL